MILTEEALVKIHSAKRIIDKDPLPLAESFAVSIPKKPQDGTATSSGKQSNHPSTHNSEIQHDK